ncbi:MAG: hypothetical protein UZ18_ATM001001612 [Armatimonadetes bacterium OLB18]|nr:MAG: hypothetical protein UZ18_ATM001001612 [Armatimonadetes bacterium OLB18]
MPASGGDHLRTRGKVHLLSFRELGEEVQVSDVPKAAPLHDGVQCTGGAGCLVLGVGRSGGRGFFFRSGSKDDKGTQRPSLRRTELSHKAAVARKPHLDLFATPDLTGLHRQQVRIEIGPIRRRAIASSGSSTCPGTKRRTSPFAPRQPTRIPPTKKRLFSAP